MTDPEILKQLTDQVLKTSGAIPQARIELDLALEKLIAKENAHAVAVENLSSFRRRSGLQ
jgi:hypothetical protein